MARECGMHGEKRNASRFLVGKTPEGSRPLRRYMRKREGNIKIDIRELGWECVE
jgi:hypothetical protein